MTCTQALVDTIKRVDAGSEFRHMSLAIRLEFSLDMILSDLSWRSPEGFAIAQETIQKIIRHHEETLAHE